MAVAQAFFELPKPVGNGTLAGKFVNGWAITGVTTFQSGLPYDIYDYSGSVGGLYYSSDNELTNPVLPLKPGITVNQAKLQGTTEINPSLPLVNSADFYVPALAGGTNGIPVGDNVETGFGDTTTFGVIQNTIGSPRFMQMSLSLMFQVFVAPAVLLPVLVRFVNDCRRQVRRRYLR